MKKSDAERSKVMERYGFSTASTRGLRSCFDIISGRRGKVLVLKFVDNIDSLAEDEARAMQLVGDFFDGSAVAVFRNRKGLSSERGFFFMRHGIKCVREADLEALLNGDRMQMAQKFVREKRRINSAELKKLRGLYNISVRTLSDRVGVSKESISRYERGKAYATRSTLDRLERFFGATLSESDEAEGRGAGDGRRGGTARQDAGFIKVNAPPFELLAKRRFRYEVGGDADMRTMKKLAEFYKSLDSVLDMDYQFFLTSSRHAPKSILGIPVLKRGELRGMDHEDALIDIIASRGTGLA